MFRLTRYFCNKVPGTPTTWTNKKICFAYNCYSTVTQEKDIETKLQNSQNPVLDLKNQALEQDFTNTHDIPSLLKLTVDKFNIDYAFKVLDILANMQDTGNINFEEIKRDVNYSKFVSVIERQANKQNIVELIDALKNLIKLKVPSSNFLVESLENDLLWNLRKASIHSLIQILLFQMHHQETDRQKKVFESTVSAIERRWTEVRLAKDFCFIYSLSNHFSASFLSKIDSNVIQACEGFSLSSLSKLLVAISISKRRPTPAMRTIAFYMFKSSEILTPKQISNIAHAVNSLNFPDEALLSKLSSDFMTQIDGFDQPAVVGSLLLCMGKMRWREKTLLQCLANWVLENIDKCSSSDLVALILTLASVSFTPDNIDDILDTCLPRLTREAIPEQSVLIDIVWSLTVLNKVSNEHVSSLLDPDFIKTIPVDDPSSVGSILKLLNIKAAIGSGSHGLQVPSTSHLPITRSRIDISIQTHVHKILRNFLPPPKYIKEDVKTDMGFIIDAEFIVDSNCKPLSLTEYSTEFGEIESGKPLPNGASRIALMIWTFKDYTIGSQSLTGQNSLASRLLYKRGYKVLGIPYYDINKKQKTIQSVQYFEKRIKEVVSV